MRADWVKNIQPSLDLDKLVFLDESSVNLAMTRLYGRAHRSKRVNDYVPDARFERVSIVSTMRINGAQAPMVFSGTLNKGIFDAYLTQSLAPTLSPGDIVIMDNSCVHKASGVLSAIYAVGASALFIPPYSPDLNPIELLWSKMKTILRKLKARTTDTLETALKTALDAITISDISNWCAHDGYAH